MQSLDQDSPHRRTKSPGVGAGPKPTHITLALNPKYNRGILHHTNRTLTNTLMQPESH